MHALAAPTEALLVEALALGPRVLPPELAEAHGRLGDAPARLTARAFEGPHVGFARFVHLHGERLRAVNLLVVPRGEGPLFAADLVAVGPGRLLLVADVWGAPFAPPALPALPAGEAPSGWFARWASPHALHVRLPPEAQAAGAEALLRTARAFCRTLLRSPEASVPDLASEASVPDIAPGAPSAPRTRPSGPVPDIVSPDIASPWPPTLQRYLDAHRTEDPALGALGRAFGEAWAARFLAEVLFPAAPR